MNLSCSSRMIKYLMFGFNLFFVISGVIIIAVGAAVRTVYSDYEAFLDTKYFSLPNMLIATGAFIFLVSFFGCCGAIKESWIMLGIFSIFLCIIFVFEFASGIAGYVLRDKTSSYLEVALTESMKKYNNSNNPSHFIWDTVQETFHCCGVDNYHDWNVTLDSYSLPLSCCPAVSGTTGAFYCNSYINDTSTTSVTDSSSTTPVTAVTTNSSISSTAGTTVTSVSSTAETTTPSSTVPTTPANASLPVSATTPDPHQRRKRSAQNDVPPSKSTSVPYSTGCKTAFGDYVKKHAVQIGGCALGLAIIQILGIIFSCHLVRQLKNGYLST